MKFGILVIIFIDGIKGDYMRQIIGMGLLFAVALGIALGNGYLTKDYVFKESDGRLYRCNERTGKVALLTSKYGGVIYGNHE